MKLGHRNFCNLNQLNDRVSNFENANAVTFAAVMKVVLVGAPEGRVNLAGLMLERALQELCLQQGYELITLPGNELPGMFAFAERKRQKQAITDLHPDLVMYASPVNLLPIRGLRIVVLLMAGADAPENARPAKHDPKLSGYITDSSQLKKEISRSTEIPPEKIDVVQFFEHIASNPDPSSTRDEHTSGKEYFFYSGPIDAEGQWERVLQAFSQFKKWQQSGLQLLLAGDIDPNYNSIFREKLNAYKYRNDIIIANAEKNQLLTAAFSVLSTGNSFNERIDIITAFSTGIPVIAHNGNISKELCGDSALYANFTDHKDLSQQMISVYKNEGIFNHLVEKGRLTSSRFNRQQMLDDLHKGMLAAIEQ